MAEEPKLSQQSPFRKICGTGKSTCSYIGAYQAANGKSSLNMPQSPVFNGLRGDLLSFHLIDPDSVSYLQGNGAL